MSFECTRQSGFTAIAHFARDDLERCPVAAPVEPGLRASFADTCAYGEMIQDACEAIGHFWTPDQVVRILRNVELSSRLYSPYRPKA